MVSDPQVWAEIDLEAYGQNVQRLKSLTGSTTLFMAVVKANAYGHGAVEVSRAAISAGADWLGVARIEEALQLRLAEIDAPILIFGFTPPAEIRVLVENDLTQTVFSLSMAEALSQAATALGHRLRAHLKLDTGMGRLGLLTTDSALERRVQEVRSIVELPGLEIEGLLTHFATADSSDAEFAERQLRRFQELIAALEQLGPEIPIKHLANSAALMNLPEAHFDLVRAGIATYGLQPSSEWQRSALVLEPVLQWKTRVIHLKQVPAGFGISYGITYQTPEPTTLATVAVGYADGLNRLLSSRGHMLVHGQRAPIVGRVCMDLTLLDVGSVPNVSVGDEVVILGHQGDQQITAEEMATTLDTINYEIVTSISNRVPRIFKS